MAIFLRNRHLLLVINWKEKEDVVKKQQKTSENKTARGVESSATPVAQVGELTSEVWQISA